MSCKNCIHCSACMHTRTATLDPYQSRPSNKDTGECSDWLTTDVQEVKHGKMNMYKPRRMNRNATYKCSVCGKLCGSYYNDVGEWKFCPHCGARIEDE